MSVEHEKATYIDFFSQTQANILGRIFSLAFTLIFVRLYSPDDFGFFNIVATISTIVLLLIDSGTSAGILRFVTEQLKLGNKSKAKGYLLFFVTIQILIFLFITIVILLGFFDLIYKDIPNITKYIIYMIPFIFAYTITEIIIAVSYIYNRVDNLFLKELSYGILRVLGLGMVYYLNKELGMVFLLHSVAYAITFFVVLLRMRKDLWDLLSHNADYSFNPFETLKHIIYMTFQNFAHSIFGFIDIMILAFNVSLKAIGVYKIANSYTTLAEMFLNFYRLAQPLIVKVNEEERPKIIDNFIRTLGTLSILFLLFTLAIGRDLTAITFGIEYTESYYYYTYLALSSVFVLLASILYGIVFFYGQSAYIATGAATSTSLNIILDIYLIPVLGVEGAAIATVISRSVSLIILLYAVKKIKFKFNFRQIFLLICAYYFGFVVVISTIGYATFFENIYLNLIAKAIISGSALILCFIGAFKLNIIDSETINALISAAIESFAKLKKPFI